MNRRTFLQSVPTALFGAALLPTAERVAWAEGRSRWLEFAQPLMGSITTIAVFGPPGEPSRRIISDAFDVARSAVRLISDWDVESPVSRLNRDRSHTLADLDPTCLAFLRHMETQRAALRGQFQPMMLDVVQTWREARAAKSIPESRDLRMAVARAAKTQLVWSERRIELIGAGRIDSGGFGKGFIADFVAAYLKRQGVRFGRVACSGDLRFFGPTQWVVDIEHPDQDRLLGRVELFGDAAISTSGSYRENWAVNGTDYHHLLDSRTGWPTDENRQLTTIASTAVAADALATGAFSISTSGIHDELAKHGAQAIVVDRRGKVSSSFSKWTALAHV